MRFVGDIALDAEVRAIASGAITDGAPVVVNADSTVSKAANINESLSSASTYGAISTAPVMAVDTANNRIVIAGRDADGADTGTGKAIVGTIDTSNDTVSFGSSVEFEDGNNTENFEIVFDSSNNKVVIIYTDSADSGNVKAVVGTVSGTSISFGTIVQFDTNSNRIGATFDSNNNKIVIVYQDNGNSSYGTAIVGTVSGTDISFGTPVVFESASSSFNQAAFDSSNNKIVVSYRDEGNNSYGTAIVGTVSGTSISFGSPVLYAETNSIGGKIKFDSSNNKVLIVYKDNSNGRIGKGVVGTVSGTGISFGSAVTFHNATTGSYMDLAFDSNTNKFLVVYVDEADSDKGKYVTGSISGTTPSFGSEAVLDSGRALQPMTGYDTVNKRTVVNYRDTSGVGTIKLLTHQQEKLTTENFIGFAHAAYADGQKATVKTTGSIARNIPQIASASSEVGTEVVFGSAASNLYIDATFDSSNNRVVIVYRDGANSNYGTAVVGNVSGTSISFGTPVTYNTSGSTDPNAIGFDSNSNKVVIAYRDGGDSDKGKAIVGTVDPSDNSITFGSEVEFNGGNTGYPNVVFDSSNNKIVIVYTDYGNSSYGTAIVGTVSGTSISFGSEVVFESAATYYTAATFDSSNNKIVVAYNDDGNSGHGTAIVGTVSGTSISFGTPAVFNAASTTSGFGPGPLGIAFDSTNNKVVIAYADGGDSSHGYAIVGTVSGTDISFGSETEFENAVVYGLSLVFDTSSNKIVISYTDETNSYYGTFTLGTVSGTSISFGTAAVFASATTQYVANTFDSNSNRVVTAYADTQGPTANNGTAIVIRPAGQGEDLTIGQQYFVQTDGTLDTSADDPSVIAGTAIGASDIIVKG